MSRNFSKNKNLGFLIKKYLQWATSYVDKRTITEKTHPNTTFVEKKILASDVNFGDF